MDRKEALKIISDVCAAYVGKLSDHQTIQTALKVVHDELMKQASEPLKGDEK